MLIYVVTFIIPVHAIGSQCYENIITINVFCLCSLALFSKDFYTRCKWSETSIKITVKLRQCRAFSMIFWGIGGWENTWKIPQKYRLNSVSKTFRIAFLTEIHQNTSKTRSKYHPVLKNIAKIISTYQKNSTKIPVFFSKKWMVFHWNNSGKHAVVLDKIGGSIQSVF